MPPKKHQQKNEPKQKPDNVDEAPLQAVVLADSYNRRFEVLCTDQPRVLLPLCSTPLLAWTLESLSLSKVKQVFIFCGVHADKIRAFIESSPYKAMLDIHCLSSQTARSAGDALRELDDMHVLNPENPFILVHSPLISNYDLSKIIDAHRKRRDVDKNFIMTMGVSRGGRPHPESPIMLVHPPSSRLLHYAPHPLSPSQPRISFPSSLFLDPFPATIDTYEIWSGTSPSSSTHGGYRDLGVDICEADVPALCTENFDYHDLRRHFVNGVLTSELLGKKIAVHVVGQEEESLDARAGGGRYVESVRDTRTFGEVTRDVLRRWAFPLAPDLNEPGGVQYELRAGNVYIAKESVVLSRTTTLNGPLLIGPRSALAHNTLVRQSTLGADCKIDAGSIIRKSYIFDDVKIGEGCVVEECMIGEGVVIGHGCKIGKGVLLGNGVRLGKGVVVPDFSRIGRQPYRGDDWDSDEESGEFEKEEILSFLGEDSIGYLWPNEEEEPPSDSEDEGEDPYEHPRNKKLLQLGRRLSNLSSPSTSISTLSAASSSAPSSPLSDASSTSLPDIPTLSLDAGPDKAFYSEAAASLQRAYEEDHKIENALLELRTLVMGYNAGLERAREEVVKFFMSKIDIRGPATCILSSAVKVFSRWGPLMVNLTSDPTLLILDAQQYCVSTFPFAYIPWFGIILRAMYETDLVGEEELVEWREMSSSQGEGIGKKGKEGEEEKARWRESWAKGKGYVDVLESMESESGEEESSEEDNDDA
ncbi:hypothetical protein LQV05_000501 [Cryptococcus neoformans]|nr:translation initiation factor eIF-2B subunit epsilon [Cryptococcus neoformans var. grubii c45]OXB39664.1 translation initiation factor eIF-2B subunit epsilon [Cryptococcus neoformans var. grubii]OXC65701.1 translation initiation factor eIF-2B subunit epsilon [Cryptococcus neoformans var. grubii MW-RSA852]UOH79496.1 hypothetical protein LQV05_000501 [Cryptococcus neoformans]